MSVEPFPDGRLCRGLVRPAFIKDDVLYRAVCNVHYPFKDHFATPTDRLPSFTFIRRDPPASTSVN